MRPALLALLLSSIASAQPLPYALKKTQDGKLDATSIQQNFEILANQVHAQKVATSNLTVNGVVTSVGATSPLSSSGGTTPSISFSGSLAESQVTGLTSDLALKFDKTGGTMTGQLTNTSTITIQGNAFSVGASTFVIVGGSATFGQGVTAGSFTGSLDGSNIVAASIDTAKLASDAVDTAKIRDFSVGTNKLTADVVNTLKLMSDAVTAAKIVNSAVNTLKLAADAVTTAKILDAQVSTNKLASDAVTTAKILDGAVTTNKLGAGAFDTTKLAADAVTTAKILDASVSTNKLAIAAVTNSAIADATIGTAKLAAVLPADNNSPTTALVLYGGNWQGTSVDQLATNNAIVQRNSNGSIVVTGINASGGVSLSADLTVGSALYINASPVVKTTETIQGNAFSVGASTFVVSAGSVSIGSSAFLTTATLRVVGDVSVTGNLGNDKLSGTGLRCVDADANGVLKVTGSDCGSGGSASAVLYTDSGTWTASASFSAAVNSANTLDCHVELTQNTNASYILVEKNGEANGDWWEWISTHDSNTGAESTAASASTNCCQVTGATAGTNQIKAAGLLTIDFAMRAITGRQTYFQADAGYDSDKTPTVYRDFLVTKGTKVSSTAITSFSVITNAGTTTGKFYCIGGNL